MLKQERKELMRSIDKRLTEEDRFARKFACWANNHKGWSKAKKRNRRSARRRIKRGDWEGEPMKWIDYKPEPMKEEVYKLMDVECPICGKQIYKRLDLVLTSNPPQYIYECKKCGWSGCNY